MFQHILPKFLLPTVLVLLVTGCGTDAEPESGCEYTSGNLLADSGFLTLTAPRRERAWHYSQHAGDTAFSYQANEGTLEFVKIGHEPWGLLTQSVNTEGLQGQRVEYSAELKLDLSEPADAHGLGYGGGLTLLAKQASSIKLSSSLDHEPNFGVHDWQRVSVIADIPEGVSYLRVGFLHQAGGKMQLRNPVLRTVVAGCEPTVTGA